MPAAHPAAFALAARLVLAFLLFAAAGCTTSETLSSAQPTHDFGPKYAAYVVDADSGRVLHEVNADASRYPASLTKMMTLYMLFEAIDTGRMSLTTEIPVSAHAAARPPSKLGFRPGETITASQAIDALVVKSANDVAVAVAEYLGGTEELFARQMTARARQLGLASTTFRNASGLPDEAQRTTARDMAVLGMILRKRFPHHYSRFDAPSFVYEGKVIRGHNRLLAEPGVDGIKTGYIRASGFNIVTSAARGGKRVVVVVMGGKSARSRDAHAGELVQRYLSRSGTGLTSMF